MVRILEEYAEKNNIPIMQKDGIEFMCRYIIDNNIKNVLEIGTAIGYSAIKMALSKKDVMVTSIERDKNMYDEATKNIQKFGLTNRIKIIYGDALDIVLNKKYDLIFIDAAKSQYINFFEKYKNNLDENGVIITDNLSFHGLVEDDSTTHNRNTKQLIRKIRKYIQFLKDNKDYQTDFYSIGDGISVTKKS